MTEVVTQPGVLASLGLNTPLFIAQLVNFSIVIFVIWKWLYKPLITIMDAREKKISDGLANAEQAKKQLAVADAHHSEMLRAAHVESEKLIGEARLDAEKERQSAMQKTQKDLERQLTEAKERLKREKVALLGAVKNEVADLILDATNKVTTEAASPETQRKWIAQALSELERAEI